MWIPGQGLTCSTGHWLSEGMPSPSRASLEDLIFCWWLLGPFPEYPVADGLRPAYLKESFTAGVMNLGIFFGVAVNAVLRVSVPSNRTRFTVTLKILSLLLMVMLDGVHIFFKAALPCFTSTPSPSSCLCLSTTLPR